jgi:hypothetical protein
MSVKVILAKLCACTAAGAIIGGGAVHLAANPPARPALIQTAMAAQAGAGEYNIPARPQRVKRTKSKRAPVRVAAPVARPAPVTTTVTRTVSYPLPAPVPLPPPGAA